MIKFRTRYKLAGFLCLQLALLNTNSYAHLPFISQFSVDNPSLIEGTLTKVEIGSPHSLLTVSVPHEEGIDVIWRVEWLSVSSLLKRNVDRTSLSIGEQIQVGGFQSIDEYNRLIYPNIISSESGFVWER